MANDRSEETFAERRERKRKQKVRVSGNRNSQTGEWPKWDHPDVEMVYMTTADGTEFCVYFNGDSISVTNNNFARRISVRPHDMNTVNIRAERSNP